MPTEYNAWYCIVCYRLHFKFKGDLKKWGRRKREKKCEKLTTIDIECMIFMHVKPTDKMI